MAAKWLNIFFRYSGYTYSLKQKIVGAESWFQAVPYAVILIISELGFAVVSLPMYLIVKPDAIQEGGNSFPRQKKVAPQVRVYAVRRRISLATFFSAGGILALKIIFIGVVSSYLLGAQALLAASQDWTFDVADDYTFTNGKISVTGGVAQLVDQGGGGNCSGTATVCSSFVSSPTCSAQSGCAWGGGASGGTANPGFNTNSTNWTYASWVHDTNGANSGNYQGSGGMPGGYVDINLSVRKNKTEAGYWRQATTTAVNNPDTATLKFDWKSISFGGAVTTYKLYAFVDTGSGVPVIADAVWVSPEISTTTVWASSTVIDVKSKLTTAGTYYVKFAAYATRPSTGDNNLIYISGFDNVSLTWSKTAGCSGTPTACSAYVTSTTCTTQGGCGWNQVAVYSTSSPTIYPKTSLTPPGVTGWTGFVETATKNGGEINYQLSGDDGVTWKYWNGAIWATTTSSTNYNVATLIHSHIDSFSTASGKIKWRAFLVSNGSQQVILDNISIGYTQNATPSISGLAVAQNTTSGYVHINYNLQDGNSDLIHLPNYEYSLTGAFAGEELTMTPVPTDPSHSGITGLTSSLAGTAHTFVWNAVADLGAIHSTTVYVRLRANDGIINSDYVVSAGASVDYVTPAVSAVTASQVPASSNIQINYNLFDHTASDILVELQVSADGGLTWTVPATSVSGDVGSTVNSGNSKSIIWQAGTDYPNQEQNSMMVRVRAKDKYQNQGSYIVSASFVLDNRAPVVATPTDLLAQPMAGATAVLVGGSFSEGNPDTNNFYVAINGGAYGSATAGDGNTATPADKSVAIGATLDGNDLISKVNLVHVDDFGHQSNNENNSPLALYKFVKPYTPPAPTISNPSENSVDVIINKHTAETDGLDYAIYESSQNLYVQSDGTLGASPYWQAQGTVTVNGLSQPIANYIFKIKSRNTSDPSHELTSESDLSSGASTNYQSPQIAINSVAQTINGTKYVVINYTGTDHQNQANGLTKYEYSVNGTDWLVMTEKSGVGSDGLAGLAFTAGGKALVFAWDVGTDLPDVEDSTVYIRLESNDIVTNSNIAVSPAFTINTAGPRVSNLSVAQIVGTGNISITYDLADGAGSNNTVILAVSDDSGLTYAVSASSKTGDYGAGVTAGLSRNIVWNAGADFSNQEKGSMRVKILATDSYGNEGSPMESADFAIDTKAPTISAVTATQGTGSALVAVTYTLADLSSSTVKFYVSADSGVTWNVASTTYTGEVGAGQTAGIKHFNWNATTDFPDQELDTMRVQLRATDSFGHQSAFESSADFSVNTKVLSISNITAGQTLGTKTVTIHYDLNKSATINLDISLNSGLTWTVATSTLAGQVGSGITVGHNKTVTWSPAIDFNNQEKATMRVRLQGIDAGGVASAYYESADFLIDTAPPLGLLSLTKSASTDTSVTLDWPAGITDASFKYYELWHGATQGNVVSRSGTAVKWSLTNDSNLANVATASTTISGLSLTGDYFVKIWAIDNYGNEATADEINVYTAPVLPPPAPVSVGGGSGYTVTTDTIAPEKPIVLSPRDGEIISSANPTLIGVAEALATVEINIDNLSTQKVVADVDGAWRFTVPSDLALADGRHNFVLRQIDVAGNVSPNLELSLNKITPVIPSVETPTTPAVISQSVGVVTPAVAQPVPPAQLIAEAVSAVELPGVPVPTVTAASAQPAVSGDIMTFSGTSIPNMDVVVYIHSDQALIYRAHADSNGVWTINHSQAVTELTPGEHTIYAVAVDSEANVKSRPSAISSFTVKRNFWVMVFDTLNLQTTVVTLVVLLFTLIWLYRIKKIRAVAV